MGYSPYQQVITRSCPAYWTNLRHKILRFRGKPCPLVRIIDSHHGKQSSWTRSPVKMELTREPLIWETAIYGSFWDSRDSKVSRSSPKQKMKHNELRTKYTDIWYTHFSCLFADAFYFHYNFDQFLKWDHTLLRFAAELLNHLIWTSHPQRWARGWAGEGRWNPTLQAYPGDPTKFRTQ